MLKGQKGITLVALIVTIIVLLILAGVAISMTVGEGGIFDRTKTAANTYQGAANNEQAALNTLNQVLFNEIQ